MKPINVMRLRGQSSGGGTVSFVSATGTSYVSGATTINSPSSPSGIQNGDGLFAIVYARSALTPPAGWTLVESQNNSNIANQTLYIYRKDTVTTGDASTAFTWTQASSSRMGLAYIVVRSTSGTITVAQTGKTTNDYPTAVAIPHNVTVPTLTATENGELFLVASTCAIAQVSPDTNTWSAASSGADLRTTATQPENRLVAATQARNAGQSNATPITWTASTGSTSTNAYSTITIRLQP